jgi:Rieske 2Fe-2S family protein
MVEADRSRHKAMNLESVRALLDSRKPGHSLPQPFYRDPELYEFDLQAIHGRSWFMVGFEIELPEPGNYISVNLGESPIVVLRDKAGSVRGFHNSCRHRGAQICELGRGKVNRLVCPYHQWIYDLDGSLVRAIRMGADFDPSQHGLKPISVETVGGCIFACLSDNPPYFDEFREGLTPLLAPHDLGNAKIAFESTIVEKANWKLVMENARECYHCAAKHPELSFTFPVGTKGNWEWEQRYAAFNDRMGEAGLPVGPADGDWWQARRFPLNEGCVSMTENGQPSVKKLLGQVGDGDIGSMRWALEPHSFSHAVGDFVFSFSAMPTGPLETVVTSKWLVNKEAQEGVDYDLHELTNLWTVTNLQDRDLAENNQRGVASVGYTPGPYSEEAESLVLRFTDWYCRKARSFIEANA